MGIIARQTIKGSFYSVLGALIGFVNIGLIMPQIFSTAEIGLTNLLISISAIFGQIGTLGFMNVTVKLFPFFRDTKNKNNGFLFLLLSVGTLGFIICAIAYYISKPYLVSSNIQNSPLFVEYVYLLIPLIFISIFYLLIDSYNRILFNASFGIFVKEFLLRILNLLGILLFYFNVFDFNAFIIYYTLAYGVPVLLICLLLLSKNQISFKPSFEFLNKKFVREIISVAGYGVISGFSGIAIYQIDRYLVNYYCDLSATGVYSTAFFFGTIILLPARSLIRISGSVIAEDIKANRWDKIKNIYKQSTNNLLLLSILIFIIIWGNINNIMQFLPPVFETGRYVILLIALAFVVQSVSAISGIIIQYSKYYKQHSYLMLFSILLIVVLNVLLLPDYGITGAAMASFIAFIIMGILQILFVKIKFNSQPYNYRHVIMVLAGACACFISSFIPQLNSLVLDLMLRSSVLAVLYVAPMLLAGYSPEGIDILKRLLSISQKNKNKDSGK
ncbi:MAG: polysaccharide biosynthesis C-terminal domain-containing protein [Bacteroidales bacterium]|nr:polysaccharide biosynthesis C-terminal domain-containing protein [Bacteroidales bacterium]